MKVTNLLFWVQDNRISEKFYKKLGFEVVRTDDKHSVVELGNFQIVLVAMRDEDEFAKDALAKDKGRGVYVYIAADDVDKLHKRLVKIGLRPATGPRDWEWGNREFILKDPDGYKLCFWQNSKV
jgi:catechol 2,3-dioxygenase-like lactoylglutathione lyase family enzyme